MLRSKRGLFLVAVATVAILVLTATALIPGAATSTKTRPSARLLAAARAALVQYVHHNGAPAQLAHLATNASASSYNWSGYVDTASKKGSFTQVSGSWTMPSVTCSPEDSIASEWVGIDGWSDTTVEQEGTLGWCFEDVPTYFTWYEIYPAGTVEVGTSLEPGDQITASVSHTGKSYSFSLTDATHPSNSFAETGSCPTSKCKDTSAEWIDERPAFTTTGFAPLADFSNWNLTAGTVTSGGTTGTISSFNPNEVDMIDSTATYNLTAPSALTSGTAFTATWDNSY